MLRGQILNPKLQVFSLPFTKLHAAALHQNRNNEIFRFPVYVNKFGRISVPDGLIFRLTLHRWVGEEWVIPYENQMYPRYRLSVKILKVSDSKLTLVLSVWYRCRGFHVERSDFKSQTPGFLSIIHNTSGGSLIRESQFLTF